MRWLGEMDMQQKRPGATKSFCFLFLVVSWSILLSAFAGCKNRTLVHAGAAEAQVICN